MSKPENSSVSWKTAVITGGTKGLGRALSLAFAEAGYEVVGVYRSDPVAAEALESEFQACGFRGKFIRQDIAADGDWNEFDQEIRDRNSSGFTLIANASPLFTPKPFHLTNWNEISEQIEVNVKGTMLVFKRLLPFMLRSRQGTVISVLSNALVDFPKGFSAYVTAKSALQGLTRAIAAEYAARGIRAFSVSPGFMETSLTTGWSGHLRELVRQASYGACSPAEIARAVLALAESSETEGQGENYALGDVAKPELSSTGY